MKFTINKAENWYDVGLNLQSKFFSIPGVNDLAFTTEIFEGILHYVESGDTFLNFKKSLVSWENSEDWQTVIKDDKESPFVNHSILRTAYSIFTQLLYGLKRFSHQSRTTDRRSIWMLDAVKDSLSSPLELGLNRLCFDHDENFWNYFYPPNSPFDRSSVRTLSPRQLKRKGLELDISKDRISKNTKSINGNQVSVHGFKTDDDETLYAYPGWDVNFFSLWIKT